MRQLSLIKNTFLQEIYNRKIHIHDYKDYRLTNETYTSTYMRAKRLNVNLLFTVVTPRYFVCVITNILNMSITLQYEEYLQMYFSGEWLTCQEEIHRTLSRGKRAPEMNLTTWGMIIWAEWYKYGIISSDSQVVNDECR